MTDPRIIPPERLEEIGAREAKATPGPWDASPSMPATISEGGVITCQPGTPEKYIIRRVWFDELKRRCTRFISEVYLNAIGGIDQCANDAEFSSCARADIPALLGHAEAQQERIQWLENEVHEWEESDAAASVLGPIFSEEIMRLESHASAQRERIAELERQIAQKNAPFAKGDRVRSKVTRNLGTVISHTHDPEVVRVKFDGATDPVCFDVVDLEPPARYVPTSEYTVTMKPNGEFESPYVIQSVPASPTVGAGIDLGLSLSLAALSATPWSKEKLLELAAKEDGCDVGVGGLAVDLGLYKATDNPPAQQQEDCEDCFGLGCVACKIHARDFIETYKGTLDRICGQCADEGKGEGADLPNCTTCGGTGKTPAVAEPTETPAPAQVECAFIGGSMDFYPELCDRCGKHWENPVHHPRAEAECHGTGEKK